jgi:hypothetical protein
VRGIYLELMLPVGMQGYLTLHLDAECVRVICDCSRWHGVQCTHVGWTLMWKCCMQGLFHPARKVREVYWRLYNSLYIGAQDALVACYPRLENDGINPYARQELEIFI